MVLLDIRYFRSPLLKNMIDDEKW